jgi:hypothetical protein
MDSAGSAEADTGTASATIITSASRSASFFFMGFLLKNKN